MRDGSHAEMRFDVSPQPQLPVWVPELALGVQRPQVPPEHPSGGGARKLANMDSGGMAVFSSIVCIL